MSDEGPSLNFLFIFLNFIFDVSFWKEKGIETNEKRSLKLEEISIITGEIYNKNI